MTQSREYARTYKQRLKGLAGIEIDNCPEEMVFENCHSIHTFGMKFDIEVEFLDKKGRVIGSRKVKKRRVVIAPLGTHAIVERPLR